VKKTRKSLHQPRSGKGVPFRPQTFGQWMGTFRGVLRSREPQLIERLNEGDRGLRHYFLLDMRPSEAVGLWIEEKRRAIKFAGGDPDRVPLNLVMGKKKGKRATR
jgi:hypothetical protein